VKRSELNRIIEDGLAFADSMGFAMPSFARWSPEEWRAHGPEFDEIRDNMLGWDVSDFGTGDFAKVGLLILTLRNGNFNDPSYPKPYAEKVLIQDEDQVLPFHFHHRKMEDIINRGGGNLIVEVANSGPDARFLDTPIQVTIDGHRRTVARGELIRLERGESICIRPRQFHRFWGERGTGRVLVGEVSSVNDDRVDNVFPEYGERLPDIIEDEAPRYLLFKDYDRHGRPIPEQDAAPSTSR
jgi:D-lyxose ketol-isomerase